jgi:hypothetical protein
VAEAQLRQPDVLSCDGHDIAGLVARYGMQLQQLPAGSEIPGSHWGAPEAGLIGNRLLARPDTPVHSALHEASHYICMDGPRRAALHTDAGGSAIEESSVCYLQILLADHVPGMGRARMCADMDAWGYSFRLGSSAAWFEHDAEDARAWLLDHYLITPQGQPSWRLRP